ncbi:MAG: response regulator transcription factor [Bacteroidia bacterium]|nr:response regulator transcription factor [Bacteroidia bacterium]
MNRIKTIIADDHQMFLDGLHLLLSQNEEFEVVGLANNGQQVMELLRRNSVEIAVLDIEMPLMDGLQTTLKFGNNTPKSRF